MSFYAITISKLMSKNNVTINLVGQGADEIFVVTIILLSVFSIFNFKRRIKTYFKELNVIKLYE